MRTPQAVGDGATETVVVEISDMAARGGRYGGHNGAAQAST